jgi:hypothetical protein
MMKPNEGLKRTGSGGNVAMAGLFGQLAPGRFALQLWGN